MKIGKITNLLLNLGLIILCALTLYPFLLTVSISFSSEASIVQYGYTLIPKALSLEAYKYIWFTRASILDAYKITIFNTVVGAFTSVLVISLLAYPLSRKDFKYRNIFAFYIFFTMLFNGGVISWYMICVNYLHLANKIWAMILPTMMNAWHVIILRTFFSTTVPVEIIESAKLDGAGEFRILFRLVLPISLPGIATIALFQTLAYWNDWWLPLMFITDAKLYNLQFLLRNMMTSIQELYDNPEYAKYAASSAIANIPAEGARMALCMVVMGPILVVYPFFQKYFIQGLTIGAVKG